MKVNNSFMKTAEELLCTNDLYIGAGLSNFYLLDFLAYMHVGIWKLL